MTAKITIPEFYQESWKYLVKIKVRPQHYLKQGGLDAIYEAARMFGYLKRQSDEKKENPFSNNFELNEYIN